MADFTIRVELHSASGTDYETLHLLMAGLGCRREINGTDASGARGVWVLPSAEYDYSDMSRSAFQVRDMVKLIADQVKPESWVLVTEVKNRAWSTRKVRSGTL